MFEVPSLIKSVALFNALSVILLAMSKHSKHLMSCGHSSLEEQYSPILPNAAILVTKCNICMTSLNTMYFKGEPELTVY